MVERKIILLMLWALFEVVTLGRMHGAQNIRRKGSRMNKLGKADLPCLFLISLQATLCTPPRDLTSFARAGINIRAIRTFKS